MVSNKDIAIIYFSRTSAAEAEEKQWHSNSSKRQNIAISRFLDKRSQSIAKKSGLSVLNFDESKQKGRSFGEKISNAFGETFALGYSAAICIGNDCVDLDLVNWQEVSTKLANKESVIGPTHRQGAYLIGMSQECFDQKSFESLGWQSKTLASDLRSYFEARSSKSNELITLRDANNIYDFERLLKSSIYKASIVKRLKNLLSFIRKSDFFSPSYFYAQRLFNFENLRAPPFA